ncbi:hypothetical protein VTJ83DRAFT_4628 [Remersonia thermophila]|uniref:Zn(2)-C6 fungal-type domain-containing protein n=1 Tax=Remersonia thermophila TaxID=72144 RepID=A0ABR4DBZ1_9PEZI
MNSRSRQGCDECRRRRRKCDESKPICGQCSTFHRTCNYSLQVRIVGWSSAGQTGRRNGCKERNPGVGRRPSCTSPPDRRQPPDGLRDPLELQEEERYELDDTLPPSLSPRRLPNGIPLSPTYQMLLSYFAKHILASLSCHPSIHQDLLDGLVPVSLESPHLMSACLALSAAGFLSRGVPALDGVDISKILGHLQSSGLSLLRSALATNQMNGTLVATCLLWCLTEIFTHRQGTSSWRIHLQGIRALLDGDGAQRSLAAPTGATRPAMKHLHQLYLSLRTLPYIPASESPTSTPEPASPESEDSPKIPPLDPTPASPAIDGFLGYSDELLDIIHEINHLSSVHHPAPAVTAVSPLDLLSSAPAATPVTPVPFDADLLLGRLQAMILRDSRDPPRVAGITTPLTDETGREFALSHAIFQQATLLHCYRKLYRLPSGSAPVRAAASALRELLTRLEREAAPAPCRTWVAMAMPLFNLGCEAVEEAEREFALEMVGKLAGCIGSSHVGSIRQALRDVWDLRDRLGDREGLLCANELLERLNYHVVLF